MIIQSGGLPLFAQSFEFESDHACQTFKNRLNVISEKKDSVMSGYFDAIKLIVSEIVEDNLNLMELGFKNYHITGIIHKEVFYIGIFEQEEGSDAAENLKTINDILVSLAKRFNEKYAHKLDKTEVVNFSDYQDFTDDIVELSEGLIRKINCRNCLEKCSTENKGCLPHKFYFEKIKTKQESNTIVLKT